MRKPASVLLTILLVSMAAASQQAPNSGESLPPARKAVSLSGTVSDDGKMFVRDSDSSVWMLENPESLKGYEGEAIRLQGFLIPQKHEMHVLVVKTMKHPTQYLTRKDDSAFRR